jgi:hypothetical protein
MQWIRTCVIHGYHVGRPSGCTVTFLRVDERAVYVGNDPARGQPLDHRLHCSLWPSEHPSDHDNWFHINSRALYNWLHRSIVTISAVTSNKQYCFERFGLIRVCFRVGIIKKGSNIWTCCTIRFLDLTSVSYMRNMRNIVQFTNRYLALNGCFFFLICVVGGGIKVHLTLRPLNGVLCQPRVIMIMEKSVE